MFPSALVFILVRRFIRLGSPLSSLLCLFAALFGCSLSPIFAGFSTTASMASTNGQRLSLAGYGQDMDEEELLLLSNHALSRNIQSEPESRLEFNPSLAIIFRSSMVFIDEMERSIFIRNPTMSTQAVKIQFPTAYVDSFRVDMASLYLASKEEKRVKVVLPPGVAMSGDIFVLVLNKSVSNPKEKPARESVYSTNAEGVKKIPILIVNKD
uniref:Lipoprotein n=1 Tax=Ditylenchus dipsaci TaxID=166011 RepID=A0A915DX75_9BILA